MFDVSLKKKDCRAILAGLQGETMGMGQTRREMRMQFDRKRRYGKLSLEGRAIGTIKRVYGSFRFQLNKI